jgi:hypothetical protein
VWHILRNAADEGIKSKKVFWYLRYALCLILLVVACVSSVSVEKKAPPKPVENEPKRTPISRFMPSDDDYLLYGLSLMVNAPERPPDYEKAKIAFESLLKEHPASKWKESTTALLQILQEIRDRRENEKFARALQEKNNQVRSNLAAENEKLVKANSALNEKMQSEIAKLVQENERLKKDIELLKDLEIKLDRRERLLR